MNVSPTWQPEAADLNEFFLTMKIWVIIPSYIGNILTNNEKDPSHKIWDNHTHMHKLTHWCRFFYNPSNFYENRRGKVILYSYLKAWSQQPRGLIYFKNIKIVYKQGVQRVNCDKQHVHPVYNPVISWALYTVFLVVQENELDAHAFCKFLTFFHFRSKIV